MRFAATRSRRGSARRIRRRISCRRPGGSSLWQPAAGRAHRPRARSRAPRPAVLRFDDRQADRARRPRATKRASGSPRRSTPRSRWALPTNRAFLAAVLRDAEFARRQRRRISSAAGSRARAGRGARRRSRARSRRRCSRGTPAIGEWNCWSNDPNARCGCGSARCDGGAEPYALTESGASVGDAQFVAAGLVERPRPRTGRAVDRRRRGRHLRARRGD